MHENSNGRGYSCRDLEGHIWNFGTYDPRQGQFLKGCGSERYQVVKRPRIGSLVLFADLLINAMTSIALIALAYLASEHALSSAHASASTKRTATGPEVQPITSVAWAIKDADEQLVRQRNARDAAERNAKNAREQLAEERGAREAAERAATDAQDQLASELSNRAGLELAIAELRKTIASHEVARPKTSLPGSPEEKGGSVVGVRIERMPNKYINLDGYKIHSGKTYAQCEQLCLAERKCVAIEFDRQKRTCELLDQLAPPLADAEADVGIKRFH